MKLKSTLAGLALCAGFGTQAAAQDNWTMTTTWPTSLEPVSYTHLTLPTKRIV